MYQQQQAAQGQRRSLRVRPHSLRFLQGLFEAWQQHLLALQLLLLLVHRLLLLLLLVVDVSAADLQDQLLELLSHQQHLQHLLLLLLL
jgi:hypothetical protein